MAISARYASLLEQRSRYGSSAKRKVLKPNSLSSSSQSIARRSADAELDSKIDLYNDGQLSNEEFLSYLKASSANPLFSLSEKVDIQDKIRDFTTRVMVEGLEASYKNTHPGSYSRVTAAKDLVSYYQNEANTMQAGTPAQSKALQQVGTWTDRADSEERSILKSARKAKRAELFYEAAQFKPNTVQALEAKAKAYDQLAGQAENDEEMTEAANYQTYALNARNKIPQLIEREEKAIQSEWVGTIKNELKKIKDDYHDGRISLETAAQLTNQVNEAAIEAGDMSTQMAVNNFGDYLQKDFEKGTQRGDIEGLTWKSRKLKGAGIGVKEMINSFGRDDDDYRSALRAIKMIPDAVDRYEKLVFLQTAYLNGLQEGVNEIYPDGFEGLLDKKSFYEQLNEQYSDKNYANPVRDTADKIEVIKTELASTVATYEHITGHVLSEKDAKELLGDVLASSLKDVERMDTRKQGILISYDKHGRQVEKAIPLNAEYTDPETNERIQTYVGKNIIPIPQADGSTKYVKAEPKYVSGQDPHDPNSIPDFYTAEWDGRHWAMDPYTGKSGLVKDIVSPEEGADEKSQSSMFKWYAQAKQNEKRDPQAEQIEPGKVEITRTPGGMISPVPEEDIVKPEGYKPVKPVKPYEFKLPTALKPIEPIAEKVRETISPFTSQYIEPMRQFQLKPTVEAFKENFRTFQVKPAYEALKQGVSDTKKWAAPYIKPAYKSLKESAKGLYEKGKEKVKSLFGKLKFW